MGLIRKTLSLSTVGVVSGSSKKQRVAKATSRSAAASAKANTEAARASALTAAAATASAEVIMRAGQEAARRAAEEEQFRYDTDPAWRQWVDEKRAREIAERVEHQRLCDESNERVRVKQQYAITAKVEAKAAKKAKRLPGSMPAGAVPGQYRYNTPPNWPSPPVDWVPELGWQPDRAWGPPPADWLVWVSETIPHDKTGH